jgi:hypothetical protein
MSATRTRRFLVGAVATVSSMLLAPAAVAAEHDGQPGMCSAGQPAPLMTLNAHANGTPKFVLNLETDASGVPSGVLILGRGEQRVYTDDLCNFWEHQPGQVPGGEGHDGEGHAGEAEVPEGATIAHAVGIGHLTDGTEVLVRADVRETEEGAFFRARYRALGQHEEAEGTDGGEAHEDEAWTWVPGEGWLPLDHLKIR